MNPDKQCAAHDTTDALVRGERVPTVDPPVGRQPRLGLQHRGHHLAFVQLGVGQVPR